MPTELWYCDYIGNSIVPFVLLALPLGGAYLYGQKQQRIAWILIGSWAVLQMGLSGFTSLNCMG
jgi:hypothetical protein